MIWRLNSPVDDSVRELSESQPDIAETGNEQMLNELVEQITAANVSLDELSDSPEEAQRNSRSSQVHPKASWMTWAS